jgi:hypothetical protein
MSGVKRKIEYVAVFILFCLCLDWRILRNLWTAFLAILFFPVGLVLDPWNYVTGAFLFNLALAAIALLVAGCVDLVIWLRRRKAS